MAYGLSASADGNNFPWVFNPPATYWDGASVFVKYIGEKEGGLDKLKGKKIGSSISTRRYGKEPIPLLEALAKDYGFELKLYPVPAAGDAEPVLALAQRPPRPARLDVHAGLGRDEPDRRQGGGQDQLPDGQVRRRLVVGRRRRCAAGRRRGEGLQDAQLPRRRHRTSRSSRTSSSTSSTRARARSPKEKVGENLYNRGVFNSMLIAEAIRTAQKITGKKVVTGEDVRRGLETLEHHRGAPEGDRRWRASRRR